MKNNPGDDLSARLRAATQAQHQALEQTPFSRALLGKTLPLSAYQAQLAAYWPLLQTLERHCAAAPQLATVWRENLRRSPRLEEDLRYFSAFPPAPPGAPVSAFIARLDEFAARRPLALLGCLYVFEGSMLGSRLLLPLLRETYQLQGDAGCRYYAACEAYPPQHWPEFKQRLQSAATDTAAETAIIDGARAGFEHIHAVLLSLLPEQAAPAQATSHSTS